MSKVELSPGLLAALALTAVHIEAEAILAPVPIKQDILQHNLHSKKTIRNRKRNKLAAQSRKRNRR